MRRNKFFAICLLSLVLAGCNTKLDSLQITPKPNFATIGKQLQRQWLDGIPCRAPCWEGITLGVTNAKEAENILNTNPNVANIEVTTLKSNPNLGSIAWDWADGSTGGRMDFDAQSSSPKIYAIRPLWQSRIYLSEVIKNYGEPSHVRAVLYQQPDYEGVLGTPSNSTHIPMLKLYSIDLIFARQGFMLTLAAKEKPVLTSSLELDGPYFFVPGEQGYLDAYRPEDKNKQRLVRWEGFKDFDYYCHKAFGENECREK